MGRGRAAGHPGTNCECVGAVCPSESEGQTAPTLSQFAKIPSPRERRSLTLASEIALASGLAGLLASQPLTVDLEILPPQNPGWFKVVRRRAATLDSLRLGAINVISRSDRMTSLDASLHLRARGWEPVWHLVARARTREDVEADLERAAE